MRKRDTDHLLRLSRLGNEEAWRELVSQYERLVYSVPMRNGLSREEAADVFQTTFLSLHRQLDQISSSKALGRWLVVVAARETYRLKRLAGTTIPLDTLDEQLIADERSANSEADQLLQANALREGLSRLAEKCRRLLARLYLDQASYDQVSSELGIPLGSIGPSRARCLEKLKKLLDPEIFEY
ncbi:MAG: sigma-70 family RNA polymerase sigma factor [Chthonomonas sp.]|nr:sigma-70 family RNA polymerase sigma factor [Chthonomonas sp.]